MSTLPAEPETPAPAAVSTRHQVDLLPLEHDAGDPGIASATPDEGHCDDVPFLLPQALVPAVSQVEEAPEPPRAELTLSDAEDLARGAGFHDGATKILVEAAAVGKVVAISDVLTTARRYYSQGTPESVAMRRAIDELALGHERNAVAATGTHSGGGR